ncbi:hypothetical protein AAIR98_001206 [Elusimicrobium simillimum]|uniref:hypothetical protein n=1 Tax=Elusimicrobium simillimum TaxID=3143438 RepID=UPI003C6F19DD
MKKLFITFLALAVIGTAASAQQISKSWADFQVIKEHKTEFIKVINSTKISFDNKVKRTGEIYRAQAKLASQYVNKYTPDQKTKNSLIALDRELAGMHSQLVDLKVELDDKLTREFFNDCVAIQKGSLKKETLDIAAKKAANPNLDTAKDYFNKKTFKSFQDKYYNISLKDALSLQHKGEFYQKYTDKYGNTVLPPSCVVKF